MHLRRAGLLAAASLAVLPAAPAAADTYTVFGCRGPENALNGADGWALAQIGDANVANTCAAGGALSETLAPGARGGSVARLRFDAPAGTRIVRVSARRRTGGVQRSEQTLDSTYELSTDTAILEKCALAADSPCTSDLVDPVDKQGLDASWARFSVVCTKGGDETCTRTLRADIEQVAVGLKDAAAPTVSGVSVIDSGDTSGVLRLRFDAADAGGGVYRALVKVDGVLKATAPLGGGACTDAAPADADPYQFTVPVPCPPLVTGVPIELDSRSLAAGPHTVQVDVEDAAGNATSAYVTQFPRPNVDGGGGNGDPVAPGSTPVAAQTIEEILSARLSMRFDRSKSTRLTNRYGRRVVIRGTLRSTRTGKGIQGARVDVYHLVGKKRRSLTKTGLKTRAGGALTLILPLNLDTRQIRFAYRALRPGPVTSERTLSLTVRDARGELVQRVK
ncbi:hypothetical protein [Paraconexibacter algicola]|uniref:Uncharacterized protein n=1 Tax=Paraconexibacter algicola TaxID=2133960 RepID=A0A2T4UDS3_9ACTN|nr:hypothetical protein [Paraconexibacter algicola]PTL55654.1 hypothetical protein C7Y72_18645 [Paraconexibacter algicola]